MGSRSTGGIATHVLELAEGLAASGHDVAVYADNMPPADEPLRKPWGAVYSAAPLSKSVHGAVVALRNTSLASGTRSLMSLAEAQGKRFGPTFAQVLGLSRAVTGHRPDVVHYHQPDMRVLYGRMAGVMGLPSVATQHSLSAFADDASAALSELVLDSLHRMDAVIAVSADVASGVHKRALDIEPVVIPNGVDLTRFAGGERPDDATASGPVVSYIGRIAPGKGVDDLIAAMPAVIEAVPGARLELAGPVIGMSIDEMAGEAGLEDAHYDLLGELGPEGVAEALGRASAFALPSHLREGQPRAIIEALASGTPVVATAIGGIPGLLRGGAGELIEPGDVAELSRALIRVLTEPGFADRLVELGLDRASEYDLAHTTARIVEVYASVAKT
jgi:phosphatidylinositol alpha-mannosyltransferase